ncbi:MAG: hypothetical protein Q8L95_00530 [Burkholderiales bacterium]|nr:hypothetical protein [Burkholderiales bacterium]
MFKNKDLIVFWTAMIIAACDVLSSGFFAIQEVTAAPSNFDSSTVSAGERPWLAQTPSAPRDESAAEQQDGAHDTLKNAMTARRQPPRL